MGTMVVFLGLVTGCAVAEGQDRAASGETAGRERPVRPKGLRQVTPTLSVDYDKKQVILESEVVLREGPLELLLCPRRTKEHESILAADVHPRQFHLQLILIGAVPGHPAIYDPQAPKPPSGQRLKIMLEYEQDGTRRTVDARQWVREIRTGQAMGANFVFAGSQFQQVPGVERAVWMGDDGDLVCLANFPGAVVDIDVLSSKDNQNLSFEAWTERIAPKGTKVRVIFQPEETRPKE